MTLRLSVVSQHGTRLGVQTTKVFGVHGGSIGRGTDNEWILPDPERYLSGKHARIDFRGGSYILVDMSSNGTYVNGAQVPLGKHRDYSLRDGDYVRLGEYELLVSIDDNNDLPDENPGAAPAPAVGQKATANDLGAELDLSKLLEPQSGSPWHMMTRPVKIEDKAGTTGLGAGPGAGAVGAVGAIGAIGAAGAGPGGAATGVASGDIDVGFAAFCRGAGVDPRTMSPSSRAAALQLAGQLLRESILGLMDLNQSRNEFRDRFQIVPPPADGTESPLNFSRGVDEALVRLLTTQATRAGSVEAIRDSFREFRAQSTASLVAMHAAFEEFLGRVDPLALAERFEQATNRGVPGAPNKGKYWDLYGEMFGNLAQRPTDGFPHLFMETFAKAYEAKLRELIPRRRTAFGGDRDE